MKKSLITSALIVAGLFSVSAIAHDKHGNHDNKFNMSFSNDKHCDMELTNRLKINAEAIEISNDDKHTLRIDTQTNVFINGEKMSLTSEQRDTARQFAQGLRDQLPKVADIALEGVKIAGVALDEVSNALGIHSLDGMTELLAEVSTSIEQQFYQGGDFIIDQGNFDSMDNVLGEEFEAKVEAAMEEAVLSSLGSILVSVGSQMLSAGGDMDAFEQKFERLGEQIEAKVEGQAKALEVKAEALCNSMLAVAVQESAMQQAIPQTKAYDVFTVNEKSM